MIRGRHRSAETIDPHSLRLRPGPESAEARRLEQLWSGPFGQAYTRRNDTPPADAGRFHHALCIGLGIRSVLEVGCNVGLNLTRVAEDERIEAVGADVNAAALAVARQRIPRGKFVQASAYALPLADASFDLVFTCGVLIHLAAEELPRALWEIHRTSRRYIWAGEYYGPTRTEVPYHGQRCALFRDDFGRRYREQFPGLVLVETGFLDRSETGFDNLSWWLFEKSRPGLERRDPEALPRHAGRAREGETL